MTRGRLSPNSPVRWVCECLLIKDELHDPQPYPGATMSRVRTRWAMAGLWFGMFTAYLAITMVTTALPAIFVDLDGSQLDATWVLVSTLLAMTVTTPIWGRLSDSFNKTMLIQSAAVIFAIGSLASAVAPDPVILVGGRILQGVGAGGLTALSQVLIALMTPLHRRSQYAGYIGVVFAAATLGGPLAGGAIVDSPLGWRGCFLLLLGLSAGVLLLLRRTLRLPVGSQPANLDLLGSTLLVAGISGLLVWVTGGGVAFSWRSAAAFALLSTGVIALVSALVLAHRAERRGIAPVLLLSLFRVRTVRMATVCSFAIGAVTFTASIYFVQYFQLARAMRATEAGLWTLPFFGATTLGGLIAGHIVLRTGWLKQLITAGFVLATLALVALGTVNENTDLRLAVSIMVVLGLGGGLTIQNLVVAVQSAVPQHLLGTASSFVIFFRSLGGVIGVAVAGALLTHGVASRLDGLGHRADLGAPDVPDLANLPPGLVDRYLAAYGGSFGVLYWALVPLMLIAVACSLRIVIPSHSPHQPNRGLAMRSFGTIDEIVASRGETIGTSQWMSIDQARVDQFASATADHQWIHVDVERAAKGPFGATIAHGYLTLSLLSHFGTEVFRFDGPGATLNYGLNKVRFPAPVPVGSRIRAHVAVADVDVTSNGDVVSLTFTVEIEGASKPACVAEVLALLLTESSGDRTLTSGVPAQHARD